MRRLSGDPGGSLGARVAHHGARILLVVVLAGLVTFFFLPEGQAPSPYEDWIVAPDDVIAEFAFDVPKTAAELEAERNSVRDAVPPTFDFVTQNADTMRAELEAFFDQLDSAAVDGDRGRLQGILVSASAFQVEFIVDDSARAAFRNSAVSATRDILALGVVEATRMAQVTTDRVTIRETEERSISKLSEDMLTSRDFYDQARLTYDAAALPALADPQAAGLFRNILIGHMRPTYVFNLLITQQDEDAAAQSVSQIKQSVLEGQAIVRRADPVGPEALERLSTYALQQRALGSGEAARLSAGSVIGAWLVNLMLFGLFGLLLFFNRPEVYANLRWLLLLALLMSVYFAAAVAIDRGEIAAEWLPIAFVALPVAVLWDSRVALFLVLLLAAITGTLPPFDSYGTVLMLMATGAAAAMSVRAVRRRSETWVVIAIISAAGGSMLLAHGLTTSEDMVDIARGAAVLAGNATVSALLATGCLFVFELFTRITTDQTLLEWADPTRPLLRRLAMEAPGTYAHTISVANLAESAATAIGANGLLTRVGVYYHDVGKMLRPHYFVENQQDGRNPHDRLKPETSANIVREHVTEGVRLAEDEKVPELVIQFILEHHGTQRIGFFYDKAAAEADGELDPARFSYPGPKPQSKETAIVMLADSCESATRALQKPTLERVQVLIDNVVEGKIRDRQLDECPLTFREIAQVKEQFVKILSGVLHSRIEYPSTKHLTDGEEVKGDDEGPDVSGVA